MYSHLKHERQFQTMLIAKFALYRKQQLHYLLFVFTLAVQPYYVQYQVLNVCVTISYGPAQAQEEPAGWKRFSLFCLGRRKFLQNRVKILEFQGACWWFCDGMCKNVLVLGIYEKSSRKVCSITKSLRSQTKVWKLATLCSTAFLSPVIGQP